jgi:hypothetical protein
MLQGSSSSLDMASQGNRESLVIEPPPPYCIEEEARPGPETPQTPPRRRMSKKLFIMTLGGSQWSILSGCMGGRESPANEDGSLNAASLDNILVNSDIKFASVIVHYLMAPKLEEGHLSYVEGSGWGFPFNEETVYPF